MEAGCGRPTGRTGHRPFASEQQPERQAYASELGQLLEAAVDALPETYRTMFMLRDIQGLGTGSGRKASTSARKP